MKHHQESEIEFRRREPKDVEYPVSRGIVVYQYGWTAEECIKDARSTFNLNNEWELINFKKGG